MLYWFKGSSAAYMLTIRILSCGIYSNKTTYALNILSKIILITSENKWYAILNICNTDV